MNYSCNSQELREWLGYLRKLFKQAIQEIEAQKTQGKIFIIMTMVYI